MYFLLLFQCLLYLKFEITFSNSLSSCHNFSLYEYSFNWSAVKPLLSLPFSEQSAKSLESWGDPVCDRKTLSLPQHTLCSRGFFCYLIFVCQNPIHLSKAISQVSSPLYHLQCPNRRWLSSPLNSYRSNFQGENICKYLVKCPPLFKILAYL